MEYKHSDIVYILSTKDVNYVNGPKGNPANPRGNWQIVGFLPNGDILLAKDDTIIKTKITNIRRIASYDPDVVSKKLDEINNKYIKKREPDE